MNISVPTQQSPSRLSLPSRQTFLLGLLLVGATLLAYLPALHAGFIWDDDVYVTDNKLLTVPDGLERIWFSLDSPSQYFPMVYTVLRVEHSLWGLAPGGYHFFNILVHAANAVLVWRLLKRLKVPAPWFAAALFALHPVEVESVAWITELKNTLSLLFSLLAIWEWLDFTEEPDLRQRRRAYALALAFQALALFSKTTACTLPAALLLVLWLQQKPIGTRRILQILPFVGLGIMMGMVSIWWERYHQFATGDAFAINAVGRLFIACHALWFYAGKLIWPMNLSFSYWRWPVEPSLEAYLWWAVTAATVAAIWAVRRFTGRGLETAAAYYVATLLPMLGFIMEYTFRYSFVADHYQYAASIGPLALAAATVEWVAQRWGRRRFILYAATLVILGVLTWRQCEIYANSETLWRATLERSPHSFIARNNLAQVLLTKGEIQPAIALCRESLQIETNNPAAELNLGYGLLQEGDTKGAIEHCQRSLALHPRQPDAFYDLGMSYLKQGRLPAAESNLRTAITYRPDFANAYCNLGYTLLQEGRAAEAVTNYVKAIELEPDLALAHNDLGSILLRQHQIPDAVEQFQEAARLDPNFVEPRFNLASVYLANGDLKSAREQLGAVVKLRPQLSQAHVLLAKLSAAYARSHKMADAIQVAEWALELANDSHEDTLAANLTRQLENYTNRSK